MLLDQLPYIFRRFESGEANGTGLTGRGRPRDANMLDHEITVHSWA
jgi:hypothetical protein